MTASKINVTFLISKSIIYLKKIIFFTCLQIDMLIILKYYKNFLIFIYKYSFNSTISSYRILRLMHYANQVELDLFLYIILF